MTPILGLVIAIVAAQLAPNVRALLTAVLALMLAATAVQSWDLGAALGANPPSTIREAGYWIVQAAIIAITLTIAYGCFVVHRRRSTRRGVPLERPGFSGRKGVLRTSLIAIAMTVVGVVGCLIAASVRTHHGTGSGNIPWTGVAGIGAGLLLLTALAVVLLRDKGTSRSADPV